MPERIQTRPLPKPPTLSDVAAWHLEQQQQQKQK